MTATAALELRGVTSGYGDTDVLRNIDLIAEQGEVTALLGSNGAGKSTLLKTVSGLIRPTAGSVTINGTDVTKLSPNKRVGHGVCHIPEGRGIFRSLTVRENLMLQAARGDVDAALERCVAAFPILGMRLEQRAGTMSGGQQQMVAMARAYAQNPRLILVDEASLGLAPIVVDEIFAFLDNVTKEGTSLLIVDQFVTRALAMASKAYVMNRGRLVFVGTPAELQRGDVFEQYLGNGQAASA
jgi:branched-chain amino acid transport system ATP-binding protein